MKTTLGLLAILCLAGGVAVVLLQREADLLAAAAPIRRSAARSGPGPQAAPGQPVRRSDGGGQVDIGKVAIFGGGLTAAEAKAWLAGEAGKRLSRSVERSRMMEDINRQYGPLLKRLNLDSAAVARFEGLVAEERLTAIDAVQVAISDGIQTPDGQVAAIREAVGEVDQQLQTLLGADDYQAFLDYRQVLPEEQTANELAQQLSGTDSPLTDAEQAQLTQLLNQMEPARYRQNEDLLAIVGFQQAPLTDAMVQAAGSILSPPQAAALQDMYAVLKARGSAMLQLRKLNH